MENKTPAEQFDEMLKQSLEGAKMPVPSGVWESVGSSLASQTAVVTQTASLKLIILKSVATVLLTAGIGFGIYNLLDQTEEPKEITITTQNENAATETEIIDPELSLEDNSQEPSNIIEASGSKSIHEPENDKKINSGLTKPVLKTDSFKSNKVSENKTAKKIVQEQTEPKISGPADQNHGVIKDKSTPTDKQAETNVGGNNTLVIPNVFTPYEQDGYNDCFRISIENVKIYSLQIFNLKGKKVFESMDPDNCWDGKDLNTGDMSPRGFYTYKLYYELNSGFRKTERGELNLL